MANRENVLAGCMSFIEVCAPAKLDGPLDSDSRNLVDPVPRVRPDEELPGRRGLCHAVPGVEHLETASLASGHSRREFGHV